MKSVSLSNAIRKNADHREKKNTASAIDDKYPGKKMQNNDSQGTSNHEIKTINANYDSSKENSNSLDNCLKKRRYDQTIQPENIENGTLNPSMRSKGNSNSNNFGESFWRENYYKLRDSRTEEYDDIESELQIRKKKEAKLQSLIDLIGKSTGVSNIKEVIEAKDSEIMKLSKKIKLYETMTCMTVKQQVGSSDEQDDESWLLTLRNTNDRTVVRFSVDIDAAEGGKVVNFTPTANLQLFPEHLQGKIRCDTAMAPVILSDIIHNLYEDK